MHDPHADPYAACREAADRHRAENSLSVRTLRRMLARVAAPVAPRGYGRVIGWGLNTPPDLNPRPLRERAKTG